MNPSAALLTDPGLARPVATLEFNGWSLVAAHGGQVMCHWRDDARVAQAAGLTVKASPSTCGHGWPQAAVAVSRDREASIADALRCWQALAPGGQLLVHGSNECGIRSTARQFATLIKLPSSHSLSRSHARVECFHKASESPDTIALPPGHHMSTEDGSVFYAQPGVFAAGRLDVGSAVLLETLPELQPASRVANILDLGCGCGVLGLSAARRWPQANIHLADADARAVASSQHNASAQGFGERVSVHWWDSAEPPPRDDVDLVLCNPPWHHRGAVDRGPGLRMIEALGKALAPQGLAVVVATLSQPFEAALAQWGTVSTLRIAAGFKVLALYR